MIPSDVFRHRHRHTTLKPLTCKWITSTILFQCRVLLGKPESQDPFLCHLTHPNHANTVKEHVPTLAMALPDGSDHLCVVVSRKWTLTSSALSQSTDRSKLLYNTCHIHPFTHTFIHWWQKLPGKLPTAHQEQFGVQYLAQTHLGMQLGGAWIRTSNLPITRQPGLPPFLFLSFNKQQKTECKPKENKHSSQIIFTLKTCSQNTQAKIKTKTK